MQKFCLILILAFSLFGWNAGYSQGKQPSQSYFLTFDPGDTLPEDSAVIKNTLSNGLTYYIRQNGQPENRADLRLVVNAGSILEDDNQQGLAHFVEHMAFNGTKHFEKQELVNYLESIGMQFGPEINAYTNFDETVYMLQLPTDDPKILEKGFLVLEDWAHNISFDDEEIDKERGVITEEWRLGRGASARMADKQFPVLFKNSRYAKRLPIGDKDVIQSFKYDTLKKFYKDWYRPDLMAVIAVGDFDVQQVEKWIKAHFGDIPAHPNAPERKLYQVPDNDSTLFAIASDPEATQSTASIYFKLPARKEATVGDYRHLILERLYSDMFNQRLSEIAEQENAPFLYAFASKNQFVRTRQFYILSAIVKENGIDRGLSALMTEALRVQQHGVTKTELERAKKSALRSMEQLFNERGKMNSAQFTAEYTRNFIFGEPFPGIEIEYLLFQRFIPEIELTDVNQLADEWITENNRVVLVDMPKKEGVNIPSEQELADDIEKVEHSSISAYVDEVLDKPLMKSKPLPSPVVNKKNRTEINVTEWQLENGVRVILKPTQFKNEEILFTAYSSGGTSLIADSSLVAAETADAIVENGGVGQFNETQLQKLLADKVVSVSPYINELREGFSGQASPKDLETLFQLIYLYFTAPREDSVAFNTFKSRIEGFIKNRNVSPQAAFQDTITAVLTQHNPRYRPWSMDKLKEMDLDRSFSIYRDRFADASNFIFFFVGNFDLQTIKPLVETYLGGLPVLNRKESWRDVTYQFPEGVIEKQVKKGIEPKSLNAVIFLGSFDWNPQNRIIANALVSFLEIRLRERIREDLGGTYDVSVHGNFQHYPQERYRISISFGSNPERVKELTQAVFSQIDSLKQYGTTGDYLEKIKEIELRHYETNLKDNHFWLNALESKYFNSENPDDVLQYSERIKKLTLDDLKHAAQQYLNENHYIRVVLYPQDWDRSN